jgi:hypothetical protein
MYLAKVYVNFRLQLYVKNQGCKLVRAQKSDTFFSFFTETWKKSLPGGNAGFN